MAQLQFSNTEIVDIPTTPGPDTSPNTFIRIDRHGDLSTFQWMKLHNHELLHVAPLISPGQYRQTDLAENGAS